MKISFQYTIFMISVFCNNRNLFFVNCQTEALPAIKCESFSVKPEPNLLACPKAHEMVAIAVGHTLNELVYANQWINATETSAYPETIRKDLLLPLLGECEHDCDDDTDCAPGLICADAHKKELKRARLDVRKANCNKDTSGAWNEEVCFRRELLYPENDTPGVRSLLSGNSEIEERGEHGERSHNRRELRCSWKCLTICINSIAPACLVLNCRNNCDRRHQRQLEGKVQRETQEAVKTMIDTTALITLATSKLRELSSDETIISKDDANCLRFLQTATCSVDASS